MKKFGIALLASLAVFLALPQIGKTMTVINQTEDEVAANTFEDADPADGRPDGSLVLFSLFNFQDSENGVRRVYVAKVVEVFDPQSNLADLLQAEQIFPFNGTPLSPFVTLIKAPGQLYLGFFKQRTTDDRPMLMSMKAARVEETHAANGTVHRDVLNVWKPQVIQSQYQNLGGQVYTTAGPPDKEALDLFLSRVQSR